MRIYFLPVGSYEPHPSLPYDIDTKIAEAFARALAEELGGSLLPPLSYSSSWEWNGSVSLRVETVAAVMRDLNDSVRRLGGSLVAVNAHGGNVGLLDAVARQEGFYLVNLYKACDIKPGHSGRTECFVAKALGIPVGPCENGAEWPEGLVVKPRIPVGTYEEDALEFHEVVGRIQRCIFKIAREIERIFLNAKQLRTFETQ